MIWSLIGKLLMALLPLVLSDGTVADPQDTTIVAFTADWCPQCVRDKPRLAELSRQGYEIRKIDPRERPELAKQYGVRTIPAYFVGGKRVDIYKRKR